MDADRLFEAVPNFSEGRDQKVIAAIRQASEPAHVLDVDSDAEHNRVVISLAARRLGLLDAVLAAVAVATDRIDIRQHKGVHPRVGAADVVPIVPLGMASLDSCREIALELAERIWTVLKVPVYLYGHGTSHTLADIRAGRVQPDLGGPDLHPTAGAVCVGARPKLVAFNVLLDGMDIDAARGLARTLRESSAGMRGVQALAFQLSEGRVQLSMNLFRPMETRPADVIAELERRGIPVGPQQVIGLCPAVAANEAAAGRLLEARLAASAAAAGARISREHGGEEHTAIALRLQRESDQLAGLGTSQDEFLSGAERAAAIPYVLRAAQIHVAELEAMLAVGARGLRDAVSEETAGRHAIRVATLDRRLGPIGYSA
jgi:glutamate formiminotransferase / 5-formyltetrahydrofolate cyclo-ligase